MSRKRKQRKSKRNDQTPRRLRPDSAAYKLLVTDAKSVSESVLSNLAKHPQDLWQLTPRFFEELIAEIFHRKGYEVMLTPTTHDGGHDVFAVGKDSLGSLLFLVECKKHHPENHVGVGIVRKLYGVVEAEGATAGIVATTSFFTREAKEFQSKIPFRMALQDYLGIHRWLLEVSKRKL